MLKTFEKWLLALRRKDVVKSADGAQDDIVQDDIAQNGIAKTSSASADDPAEANIEERPDRWRETLSTILEPYKDRELSYHEGLTLMLNLVRFSAVLVAHMRDETETSAPLSDENQKSDEGGLFLVIIDDVVAEAFDNRESADQYLLDEGSDGDVVVRVVGQLTPMIVAP